MRPAARFVAAPRAATGWSLPGRRPRALGAPCGWLDPAALELLGRAGGEPAGALEALFEARPSVWLRRMPGRETFAWPGTDGRAVAKRFLGDQSRDAWSELLRLRAPRSPGRREGENLLALEAAGVPVPRALGWWEEANPGAGWTRRWARSAVLMERVEHRQSLRDAFGEQPVAAEERWGRPLAELVARLHQLGWYHRDLYLQHVVLGLAPGGDERLVLLDVGRARRERRPRRRWFVKDLAALLHSAPPRLGSRAALRFLARYAAARGLDRGARRRLARDVGAKAARIAAHAPRHVDPDDAARGGAA